MPNSPYPNRKTPHLQNWNYNSKGQYFVTGVTRNRDYYFGEIKDGILELTELGKELHHQLQQTPFVRPDMNITLKEFQVMPNHFHAIIGIGNNEFNSAFHYNPIRRVAKNNSPNSIRWDAMHYSSNLIRWDAMHGVPTNDEYPFNKFRKKEKLMCSFPF